MTTKALQNRLTDVVLANTEVVTVYSLRSNVHEIVSRAVGAVNRGHDQVPKVRISNTAAGTTAEVSVGVTDERSASAVCRNLHDSIHAELLSAQATPPFNITVKISSIT